MLTYIRVSFCFFQKKVRVSFKKNWVRVRV